MKRPPTELIAAAVVELRRAGKRFRPVIMWMMAREKREREEEKPRRRRKQTLFLPFSRRKIELFADDVKRLGGG